MSHVPQIPAHESYTEAYRASGLQTCLSKVAIRPFKHVCSSDGNTYSCSLWILSCTSLEADALPFHSM